MHVGAHLRSPNRDHPCVGAPHPSDERIGASKLGVRRASCVGDIAARAPWRHRRAGASQDCRPTLASCKRLTGIHFSHSAATILRGSAASLGRKDRRAQNSVPRERATGVPFALIGGFPRVWGACMARPWRRRKNRRSRRSRHIARKPCKTQVGRSNAAESNRAWRSRTAVDLSFYPSFYGTL